MVQRVENPPAVQETWVRSMGWEDHLGESMSNHSNILAWWATVHGVAKSLT